jgi:hypothetical protein
MIKEIELHRKDVRVLGRRPEVRRLGHFSWAARGDFDAERG